MPINVLEDTKPAIEIVQPVKDAIVQVQQTGMTNPETYDWSAILPSDLRQKAEDWAKQIDPSKGDVEISGFAADIMAKIKQITESVLEHAAVRDIPEAQEIFSTFLDDLNKIDFDFKLEKPNWLDKAMKAVGAAIDKLGQFLDSIKSIDSKLDHIEATIQKQIFVLQNFLEVLQQLKNEYKTIVPVMFAATYAMQLVVKREVENLETLKIQARQFSAEHNGQGNPILDDEIQEKETQIDLCRQRLFQLAMGAAKGYIMTPVIEVTMKAARIIKSEMENTINSTLVDIRATLVVIIAQQENERGEELVENSAALASKVNQALGNHLDKTTESLARLNQTKAKNIADLKQLTINVTTSIKKTREYSAGLIQNLTAMDDTMAKISRQISQSLRDDSPMTTSA